MSNIKIVSEQFALHSRLFNNVLDGIDDIKGHERLSEEINHIQWIAGHLTNTRYNYASMLGIDKAFPYKDLYADPTKPPPSNRAIDASIKYPSIAEISKYWNDYAAPFAEAVSKLSDALVVTEMPFGTPIGDKSMLGLFGFLSSHEIYHIGQMSIIRKYLGLGAMSYK